MSRGQPTMESDRRAIPEPLLLAWYVIVAPVGGALAGAAAFQMFVSPWVPLWLRGAGAVVAGAAGLLLGGMAGSLAPRSVPYPRVTGDRRVVVRRVVVNAAVVVLVVAAVGIPLRWGIVAFSLAIAAAIALFRARRHSRL
jgi:hypothetical protein